MRQQVNLYRPELSSKLPFPNFEHAIWTIGAVVVVVALFTAVRFVSYQQQADQVASLAQSKTKAESELLVLQELLEGNSIEPVEAEIVSLNKTLVDLRNIRNLMSGKNVATNNSGNLRGFSTLMEGLSRQHLSGISLSAIGFSGGGSEVVLKGEARSPELVPKYLSRLDTDQAFAQVHFGQLRLNRQAGTGRLMFIVEHHVDDEGDQ